MPVPNQFANVTTSIPLSQLDANFNTPITLGNTAIQLGNTVTTLNNMTLANVTISSGSINVTSGNITVTNATVTTANVATANVTTSQILNYGTANGVAYLNTSKALTTGTTLVFDGTNLGVGTSSPGQRLDVRAAAGGIYLSSTTGTNQVALQTNNSGGDFYFGIDNSAGNNFNTGTAYAGAIWRSGANPICFVNNNTERARFNATGALVFAGGTTTADGIGITFPATQSASSNANTLDDYEEGTWTPQLQFGNANVGMTGIFSGRYTKIGNVVTLNAFVQLSNKGSSTGGAQIANLPFNPVTVSQPYATATIYVTGLITLSSGQIVAPNINGTITKIDLNGVTTTTGVDFNLTQGNFNSSGTFWLNATYITNT